MAAAAGEVLVFRAAPSDASASEDQDHRGRADEHRAGGDRRRPAEPEARGDPRCVRSTKLSVHPGWVATRMGTLDGTVAAEMEVGPSVRGVADVVERHRGSGENLYRDWEDHPLDW